MFGVGGVVTAVLLLGVCTSARLIPNRGVTRAVTDNHSFDRGFPAAPALPPLLLPSCLRAPATCTNKARSAKINNAGQTEHVRRRTPNESAKQQAKGTTDQLTSPATRTPDSSAPEM
jgi:hypothetical protein